MKTIDPIQTPKNSDDPAAVRPQVSLRPMVHEDLAQVTAIDRHWFPVPWKQDQFEGEMAKPYALAWVLTDDETDSLVYGYVVCHVIDEQADLLTIAVSPNATGFGFGTLLITQAIRNAGKNGAKLMNLEVRRSNQVALKFYHRFGFQVLHVRKSFYANGEDALILRKTLESVDSKH